MRFWLYIKGVSGFRYAVEDTKIIQSLFESWDAIYSDLEKEKNKKNEEAIKAMNKFRVE